jgi:hypothetical protein
MKINDSRYVWRNEKRSGVGRSGVAMTRLSRATGWIVGLSFVLGLTLEAAVDFGKLPDAYSGNWEGTLTTSEGSAPLHAAVVENKQGYEITLRTEADPRSEALMVFSGKIVQDSLVLGPALALEPEEGSEVPEKLALIRAQRGHGAAQGDQLRGEFAGPAGGEFQLVRQDFVPSPTLGLPALAGAVILFDGTDVAAWESRNASAEAIQWIVTPARTLEVVSNHDGKRRKQDLKSKEIFGDYTLHLEFQLAHKPAATGQGRSNSGIFHLGFYETQILDSFGSYGYNNDCGGIYKTREPDRNVGYPAGLWQTYDITVRAPRFDAGGQKTANARLTVSLNGIVVHDDVEVPKPTAGGKEGPAGPIILQDHGNPVQFRNIWVRRQ